MEIKVVKVTGGKLIGDVLFIDIEEVEEENADA